MLTYLNHLKYCSSIVHRWKRYPNPLDSAMANGFCGFRLCSCIRVRLVSVRVVGVPISSGSRRISDRSVNWYRSNDYFFVELVRRFRYGFALRNWVNCRCSIANFFCCIPSKSWNPSKWKKQNSYINRIKILLLHC